MRPEIRADWQRALRRSQPPIATVEDLVADLAGQASRATIYNFINGTRRSDRTAEILGDILGIKPEDVMKLSGARDVVGTPFYLGALGAQLTGPQRKALKVVARAMLGSADPLTEEESSDDDGKVTVKRPVLVDVSHEGKAARTRTPPRNQRKGEGPDDPPVARS